MTVLSVNVNKIAVLRNSRGGREPDVLKAAETCLRAGAHGITVHPRPDLRHIRPDDVKSLAGMCRSTAEFNIEGNPFAPPQGSYPGLLSLLEELSPTQATLVPDSQAQLTSDHGFDPLQDASGLASLVTTIHSFGCRVTLFVDPGCVALEAFRDIGVDRIEIYTGPYANQFASGVTGAGLDACLRTATAAARLGLGVNAGHDLNQLNLPQLRQTIPWLAEVSIGHALIAEALYAGLTETVGNYVQLCNR